MESGYVTGKLTVELTINDTSNLDEILDRLSDLFPTATIDTDCDGEYIYVKDENRAKYSFYPGVMYTRNGDGYPDEYEDDLPYGNEEDIKDDVRNALCEIDFNFMLVMYERVYDDDYDY